MNEMTPEFVAGLARDAYRVAAYNTIEDAYIYLNARYKNTFIFNNNNLLKGKTGGPDIIQCRTAFGFTLIGQGRLKGHAFILFRGTKFLADWLTNFNLSVSSSACGQP